MISTPFMAEALQLGKHMHEFIQKNRTLRRAYHVYERTIPFLKAAFSKDGLGSQSGRQLIMGKARRVMISFFPPLAHLLQKYYGMQGGCAHCSSSCKLLFQCPHWEEKTSRCSVYEDRPNICRLFPITPGDIADRDLVAKGTSCGFTFEKKMTKEEFLEELKRRAGERRDEKIAFSKADPE